MSEQCFEEKFQKATAYWSNMVLAFLNGSKTCCVLRKAKRDEGPKHVCDGKFRQRHRLSGSINVVGGFSRSFYVCRWRNFPSPMHMFWSCVTLGFFNSGIRMAFLSCLLTKIMDSTPSYSSCYSTFPLIKYLCTHCKRFFQAHRRVVRIGMNIFFEYSVSAKQK
jgi:hypothetical protein